jgi:hypothetical protein
MQPSTNYFTIAINNSLLKQRHGDTIDQGKIINCIIHHVCQEITVGIWRDLAVGGDGEEPPQGREAAPAWRRRHPARGGASDLLCGAAAHGGGAPLPFFFLGDGAVVEEIFPLLWGIPREEISWLWVDASKSRVSHHYIEVEMQSWPLDGCPFDPRDLGHF